MKSLSDILKKDIRLFYHGSDDESLPIPIVKADVCASYFDDEMVMVSHSANTAGIIFHGHEHEFDHIAICGGGVAMVEIEGEEPKLLGNLGSCIIPAGKKHTVISIEGEPVVGCFFPKGYG